MQECVAQLTDHADGVGPQPHSAVCYNYALFNHSLEDENNWACSH